MKLVKRQSLAYVFEETWASREPDDYETARTLEVLSRYHFNECLLNFTFYVSLMSVNYIIRSAGALICKLTEMTTIASVSIIGYNLFWTNQSPLNL